jgi:hypothetical protein
MVANKDERAYIDVLFFSNRRTSNSASSSHLTATTPTTTLNGKVWYTLELGEVFIEAVGAEAVLETQRRV